MREAKVWILLPLMTVGVILLFVFGWLGITFSLTLFLTFAAISYLVLEGEYAVFALLLLIAQALRLLFLTIVRPRLTWIIGRKTPHNWLSQRYKWRWKVGETLRIVSEETEKRYTHLLLLTDTAIGNRGGW